MVTENAGNWLGAFSGLHVYRLDEASVYPPDLWNFSPYTYLTPNGLTPPAGWSSMDYHRYWGVFVTDWINLPKTYDATYCYSGNPSVPVDDGNLGLGRRDDYSDRTWTNSGAVLNTGADTLALTGEAGTEYVLGGTDAPLAIVLASFTASVKGECIEIAWETVTEIDTLGFVLWRSEQKDGQYLPVPDSYTKSNAMIETQGAEYSFTDCDAVLDGGAVYYYKLEEIDMDNARENLLHGPIGPAPNAVGTVLSTGSNGSNRSADGNACFVSIIAE